MDAFLEALGQVVREHRIKHGLTQDDLGTRAGYGAGAGVSISRIEAGLTRPGPERFDAIAKELGLAPAELESAASRRTSQIASGPAEANRHAELPAVRERLEARSKRIRMEIEQRQSRTSALFAAFNEAHDRARDEFVLPFREVAGEISDTPHAVDDLDAGDVATVEKEAAFRIAFAQRGVSQVISSGATGLAIGLAPDAGRAARYLTFRTAVAVGTSSTDRPIAELRGIAQTNAAHALLGGGTRANGGRGIDGGKRLLTGIEVGTALLVAISPAVLAAMRSVKQRRQFAAMLDALDAQLEETRGGFEALEAILPLATEVLDEIAVHGGRALGRWEAQLPRPLKWGSLRPPERARHEDFIALTGCLLAVTAMDFAELMECTDEDRPRLVELAEQVVNQAHGTVRSLV